MSYDLFFRSRDGRPPLAELERWFADQPHTDVADGTAVYDNPDTAVSFTFAWSAGDEGPSVAFHLPYLRPSSFALEAAVALTAFTAAFPFAMSDPQSDGRDALFTTEGFLRGYATGSRAAYGALGALGADRPVLTLPQRVLADTWAWNHARATYLERLHDIEYVVGFVAPVLYLRPDDAPDTVLTAAVWGPGNAGALPEVDGVVALGNRGDPPRILPIDTLRPLLDRCERREPGDIVLSGLTHDCGLPHWVIYDGEAPPELLELLATGGAPRPTTRVAPNALIDREWVAG